MSEAGPDNQNVTVLDAVQTSAYTYLYVNDNIAEYWIAGRSMEAREGEEYYISGLLEMDNFYSKELDRNFEKIWFVSEISKKQFHCTILRAKWVALIYIKKKGSFYHQKGPQSAFS